MNYRSVINSILWLLFVSLVCCFSSQGKIITVNKNSSSSTSLQQAVDQAQPYDTIEVHDGEYHEYPLTIDTPLTLQGINNPVLDGDSNKVQLIVVQADSVVIEGFTLKDLKMSFLNDLAAIKVIKSEGGVIRNNRIQDAFFGIYLQACEGYKVHNNHITGHAKTTTTAGNAIHLWKTGNSEICHNYVAGYRDGIYFEFVNNSVIHHNTSVNHLRYGLHFMFSDHDIYRQNTFRNSGAGVAVMFSEHINMVDNRFIENKGGASYGLLLKEINFSSIRHNSFNYNTVGITAEGTNDVIIDSNEFINNGKAIDMKGNCLGNKVRANNFIANTFEIITNTDENRNTYRHNYWSQYNGYDLNGDGIGDVPHRPLSLFGMIINKIPAAAVLLHSFFIKLLDFGERIFPTLIAEDLKDPQPQMSAYAYH